MDGQTDWEAGSFCICYIIVLIIGIKPITINQFKLRGYNCAEYSSIVGYIPMETLMFWILQNKSTLFFIIAVWMDKLRSGESLYLLHLSQTNLLC